MERHRCVVIRHGETEWSRTGQHTGRTDIPLLPEGEEQARELGRKLAGWTFAMVLTSPLVRARDTARLAGLGDNQAVDPDLAEWDYGDYEGLTTPEIREDVPGWDLFVDGAPDGEDVEQVGVRADRVIGRILSASGDVACVAHGHLLRVLAARWIGLDPSNARSFALEPGSVGLLGWERDQPVISRWNVP